MTGADDVSGALNFRDVGGLPAGAGTTRRGVLFRSGDLARLTPEGVDALRRRGVRHVIDLRTDAEVTRAPARGLDGSVAITRVPVFAGSAESFFETDASLGEMYRALLTDSAAAMASVVRGILESNPVLVHCAIGKDRTGVAIALTLAAAGVDDDAVVADYALTESRLPERHRQAAARWAQAAYPGARHAEALMTRSPAGEMRALLAHVRDRHGSAGRYLRDAGVTREELAELGSLLVEIPDERR